MKRIKKPSRVRVEDFWIETWKPEEFTDELAELCVKYAASYTEKVLSKKLDIKDREYSFNFDPWIY